MSSDGGRLRLAVVGVITLSLFSALFARLWYLQVLDSKSFVAAATSNQVRFIYEEAPRGRILDRQGRVIVDNKRSETITVDRVGLGKLKPADRTGVLGRLAALLRISGDELQKRLADVRFSPYKPVPVAEDVPEETVVYLMEHSDDFPTVKPQLLAERSYPHGPLAAHLLGYVGEINDRELGSHKGEGYRLGDTIGKSGVEYAYERDLRGQPGVTKIQVDARGKVLGAPLAQVAPVPGHDVQLTIDLDVQALAEDSLVQGLEAARAGTERDTGKHFAAPAGSVVVTDPRDGSVIALASYPTFNPADFVNGIKPDVYAALSAPGSQFPLENRAMQGLYAPGSTFKLVTATSALQHGLIAGNTTFNDTGSYTVPHCKGEKCTFKNALGAVHGRVNLPRAITVSSDVYFYKLGADFWINKAQFGDAIQDTAKLFGLGKKTGIVLPSELGGRIPTPDIRRQLHHDHPEAFPEGRWFTGDNVNLAIGQGEVAVTPLQLCNAYATFANGGTRFEPRVAARVLDPDGKTLRDEPPKPVDNLNMSPAQRDPIMQGLRGVISSPEGTAAGAFAGFPTNHFAVAGKTGTAQVHNKQDTALFAAFAPADNPQYAIAVVLEEAGFGGEAAAPVARRVLEGIAGQPPGPVRLGTGQD